MFRSLTNRLAAELSDLIDDMLVGDYDYVADGDELYADVDYFRLHPHHDDPLTWTPVAGRGLGPQRTALAGPQERRPGTVPARPGICLAPARSAAGRLVGSTRPSTAAGRSRVAHA